MSKTHWLMVMLALTVALLLPALLAAVPSQRERSQARMRRQALKRGVGIVALVDRKYNFQIPLEGIEGPGGPEGPVSKDATLPAGSILYVKPGKPASSVRPWFALRNERGQWEWLHGEPPEERSALDELSGDVFAAQCDSRGAGVYWRERGGPESLLKVMECLDRLSLP